MDLQELLHHRRDGIVRQWVAETLSVYPEESSKFLRETRDRFANPAGTAISEEIGALYDALLCDAPPEELAPRLDRVVQITCIQDVTASQAVAFAFRLKAVLRRELTSALEDRAVLEQFLQFESRIDRLAMSAFESYAGIQQRLADIRVREVQGRVSTLMKMAQLNWEDLPVGERHPGGGG